MANIGTRKILICITPSIHAFEKRPIIGSIGDVSPMSFTWRASICFVISVRATVNDVTRASTCASLRTLNDFDAEFFFVIARTLSCSGKTNAAYRNAMYVYTRAAIKGCLDRHQIRVDSDGLIQSGKMTYEAWNNMSKMSSTAKIILATYSFIFRFSVLVLFLK